MIISSDSVIIYSGPLKKNTAYQEIPLDEMRVKAILAKEKTKAGEELSVLLKLSHKLMETGGVGGGMMEPISILKNWAIESGITNIVFADMDARDKAVFKLEALTWAMIDSFRLPKKLDLNMPKDEPGDSPDISADHSVSVILVSEDNWWCYSNGNFGTGAFYDIKGFQRLMTEKKKAFGDSLVVIIKPLEQSTYKATVDALDQMTINKIKKYAIVKPLAEEEKMFSSPESFEPPQPVKITIPESVTSEELPKDNAFLIEIRKDQSIWYQPLSSISRMAPQKVNAPVTKNLAQIIADYERSLPGVNKRYLLKGNSAAAYSVIQQVVNALKENNIYKYNLVTSLDQ